MATKKKEDLLDFDRGKDWVSPYILEARRKEEEKKLKDEEIQRKREDKSRQEFEALQAKGGKPLTPDSPFYSKPKSLDSSSVTGDLSAIGNSISATRKGINVDSEISDLYDLERLRTPEARATEKARLAATVKGLGEQRATAAAYAALSGQFDRLDKAEELFTTPGAFEQKSKELFSRKEGVDQKSKVSEDYYKKTGSYISRTVADIAGTPENFLSIPAGMIGSAAGPLGAAGGAALGSLPMMNIAYDKSFARAKATDVDTDTARKYASLMAGSEVAIEAVGGKIAGRFGLDNVTKSVIEKYVMTNAGKAVARAAGQTAAGAGDEVLTQAVQDTAQQLYAASVLGEDSKDTFGKFLHKQIPRNEVTGEIDKKAVWGNYVRVAAAGMAAAAGPAAVHQTIQLRADNNQQRADSRALRAAALDGRVPAAQGNVVATAQEDMSSTAPVQAQPEPTISGQNPEDFAKSREASRQRKYQTDIAYAEREIGQIRKGSNPYTLAEDMQRISILQQEIGSLKQAASTPVEATSTPAPEKIGLPFNQGDQALMDEANALDAETTAAIEKDAADLQKAGERARTKARNTFIAQTTASTRSLTDPMERKQAVASRRAEWDAANPVENFVAETDRKQQEAIQKAAQAAEKAQKKAAPIAATAVPETIGAPSETVQSVTEDTTDTVEEGATDPAILGILLANRKAQGITDEQAQAREATDPTNEVTDTNTINTIFDMIDRRIGSRDATVMLGLMKQGKLKVVDTLPDNRAGEYDGDTLYVSAQSAGQFNLKGLVADVVGHEGFHGTDASGVQSPLGKKHAKAMSDGLMAAARSGDKDAVKYVALATFQDPKGSVDLDIAMTPEMVAEMPANAINYANKKAQQRGRPEAVGRTVLSALRTRFKEMTGMDANVNMEDLAHLSARNLNNIVTRDLSIKGDISGIVGEGNKQAMVMSGGNSAQQRQDEGRDYMSADGKRKYIIADNKSEVVVPKNTTAPKKADKVLLHDDLYNDMPELRDVNVVFENEPGRTTYGWHTPSKNGPGTIYLNMAHLGHDTTRFGAMHKTLLHEMQHAAQGVAGSTGGASPINYMSTAALETLPKIEDGTASSEERAFYKKAYDKAWLTYRKVLGEQEAFFTADNMQSAQAELDEDFTGDTLENSFNKYGGGILGQDGQRLTPKYAGGPVVESLGKSENTPALGMSMPTEDISSKVPSNSKGARAWRGAKKALLSERGYDKLLTMAGNRGTGEASALSFKLENILDTYNNAVLEAAKVSGKTEKQVLEAIMAVEKKLNPNTTTYSQRARILKGELNKAFPGSNLAEAIQATYDNQRAMTETVVNLRAGDSKRMMDDKEKNTFLKIINDDETYTTRVYMMDLDKGGTFGSRDGYAERLLKAAELDPNSTEGKLLQAGVASAAKNWLLLPNNKELEDLTLSKLVELSDSWALNVKADADKIKDTDARREFLVKELSFINDVTEGQVQDRATGIIKDLLLNNGRATYVGASIRGKKQNRTVLEARTDLPEDIRNVMGEVTDPFLLRAVTGARLTGLIGQTTTLMQIFKTAEGTAWAQREGGKFQHRLEGAAYGPLNGKYVDKDTLDFMGTYVAVLANYDTTMNELLDSPSGALALAAKGVGNASKYVASRAKLTAVVENIGKMLYNLGGSWAYALGNGMSPKYWAMGAKAATAIAVGNASKIGNKEYRALGEEALRYFVADSAAVQEMRGGPYEIIESKILGDITYDAAGKIGYVANRTRKVLGKWEETAAEVYAAQDVWVKIGSYFQRRDLLTEFNKLEGGTKTDEQIKQQAARTATYTNISWTAAIPIVKWAEQFVPFATPFATYKTEVVRSTIAGYAQVYADAKMAMEAKTPEGRNLMLKAATTRFIGLTAVIAGPVAGTMASLAALGPDDEEKRKALGEWDQNRVLLWLGQDDTGAEHFFSWSRFDPRGVINDSIVDVIRAEDKAKALMHATKELILGDLGTHAGVVQLLNDAGAAMNMFGLRDEKSQKTVIGQNIPAIAAMAKTLDFGADLGENMLKVVQDLFLASQITVAADGTLMRVTSGHPHITTALKTLGLKSSKADPARMVTNAAKDYNKEQTRLKKKAVDLVKEGVSGETLVPKLLGLLKEERENFDGLVEKTSAFTKFDAPKLNKGKPGKGKRTKEDIRELLVDGEILAERKLGQVFAREFISEIGTQKMFDQAYNALIKELDSNSPTYKTEVEDIKNRINLMRAVYKTQQEKK